LFEAFCLFFEARPGKEIEKVEHVKSDQAKEEDEEKAEDELRGPDDDIHDGWLGLSCRSESSK